MLEAPDDEEADDGDYVLHNSNTRFSSPRADWLNSLRDFDLSSFVSWPKQTLCPADSSEVAHLIHEMVIKISKKMIKSKMII